jgi:hypothetical protein
MRKILPFMVISCMVPSCVCSASEATNAYNVLDQNLRKSGGGLVSSHKKCPRKIDNMIEVLTGSESAKIDLNRSAVVVFTELCSGGNRLGEYLIITDHNSGHLISDIEIGDYNFLVDKVSVNGNLILMEGQKWGKEDGHCCPSIGGTLEYNIDSKKQRFIPKK